MELLFAFGYLGSGKTTFLRRFLEEHRGKRVAVLVNEFGKEDVDGKILSEAAGQLVSVTDGSIFCSCRSDKFVESVLEISKSAPDILLVEASGLANPFPMTGVLDLIFEKAACPVHFAGVVTLVDALNFEKTASCVRAAAMQIAAADLILVNKSDLAAPETTLRVEKLMRENNPGTAVEVTARAGYGALPAFHTARQMPQNVQDVIAQKCTVLLNAGVTRAEIDAFSNEASAFCHRIKGCVTEQSGTVFYEYVNGKSSFQEGSGAAGHYLVLLSVLRKNLTKETERALAACPVGTIE